ncbi:MAG: 4Fe-4S dicluster domain-containing protein [Planctomycetota bacterium]|jgi:electron transport complex protein RnfB
MPLDECEGLKPPVKPGDADGVSRREVLRGCMMGAGLLGIAGTGATLATLRVLRALDGKVGGGSLWQIDPLTCTACGKCATNCVLEPSAVRCVHAFRICGYCDLCSGFFELDHARRDSGAENQLCPTGAITRTFVDDPYFEYTVDPELCVGCLQVRHDLCVGCNECSIAKACPSDAFRRVPTRDPYIPKDDSLVLDEADGSDEAGGERA